MSRNLMVPLLQFFCRHAERASNRIGIGFVIQGAPQIHHQKLMTIIHHLFHLLRRDAGDPQFAQKKLPMNVLVHDVGGNPGAENRGQP